MNEEDVIIIMDTDSGPISTVDETISMELAKQNITEAILSTMKEEYGKLKIDGVLDKAGWDEVHNARMRCVKLRGLTKNICTKGREEALAIQRMWKGKEDEITNRIWEIEEPLERMEKAIDAEDKAIKEENKRKREATATARTQELFELGARFDGSDFVLNDVSFLASDVKTVEEELYQTKILPLFKEEHAKNEANRIEQDRIKKQQDDELKEKLRKLQEQQDALEKAQKVLRENEQKIEQQKKKAEEDAKRKAAEEKRAKELAEQKIREQKEKERQDAIRKEEELNKASDKEKYAFVSAYLLDCPMPEMKTSAYRIQMESLKDFIQDFADFKK